MVHWLHFHECLRVWGDPTGCHLTTLLGNTAVPSVSVSVVAVPVPAATPKKRRGWLPLLTVLFLISYGLMTMLIVEQGRTIDSQRALIHELYRDSNELSSAKMKALQDRSQAQAAQNQSPVTQNPSSQFPSNPYPSTQVPEKQIPSSQAAPQQRMHNQSEQQKQFQMPSKPASDLADDRRSLITI